MQFRARSIGRDKAQENAPHQEHMKRSFIPRLAVATGLMALVSACTMHDQDAPPLTGPSEFALSVSVAVTPDVLSQDGA